MAVGAAGTVVAWRDGSGGPIVEQFAVGDVDLRAIDADESGWWVVGDEGMAAVSGDAGQTWAIVDLAGTSANLWSIIRVGARRVVVGDEVVLVQEVDGTWLVPPPCRCSTPSRARVRSLLTRTA